MAAANEAKLFTALLNGLAKRIVFQDPEFTDALLKDQIYPNLDDAGALAAACAPCRAAKTVVPDTHELDTLIF